jgi:polo-like kinase 4
MPEERGHTDSLSIKNYDVGSLLGRGGFAEVYLANDRATNEDVAIKFISKSKITDQSMYARVRNEINIHSKLKHHAIVNVLNHFEDQDNVYIVLELCVNGNLFKHIKTRGKLNETVAAKYCFQLLEAVQHLQSQHGVIHRDLKLSNILLDQHYNVKLCDFGLAAQLGHPDEEHFTICGTPNYIAPEVASQQAHGFPVDLWSLGCLLFAMLTGSPPFEQAGHGQGQGGGERGVQATLQSIVQGKYMMPKHTSYAAQDFLRSLLHLVSR